jgi:hypothetical protein
MKEKIYTIPVNDAFDSKNGCPLCTLEKKLNNQLLDYYLGPSLMEPDVRKSTNEKGFCRDHLEQLYNCNMNRLGLGLMLHTHMNDLIGDIGSELAQGISSSKKKLFQHKQDDYRKILAFAADKIDQRANSCVICDRIEETMDRYMEVLFYLYFADLAFKVKFDHVDGFCLPHLASLLRGAGRYLNHKQAVSFISALTDVQKRSLEKIRDDVEWFTLKFDYRNHSKSWKNSKDALPRSIRQLRGRSELNE